MLLDRFKFNETPEDKLEKLFDEACKQGAVLVRLHFDTHGANKEAVSGALVDFIGRVSKEDGVLYCKGEVDAPIEEEDGSWSTNAEVRVLAEAFYQLVYLCFRYGPIGVEVDKPAKLDLSANDMQGILLDASKISNDYSRFIYDQVLSNEKKTEVLKQLDKRAAAGKRLRERAEDAESKD
ncbi:hypothetical protein COX86_01480 [Candidatus Micrarchaeota archaeon CG_4_10_14_0_2_um_filter_60_11]|nr:MAG: hypothetical protein AUJ16_01505 [Candidatus Micrarchaeota archaeon CG1_02_60_51]PIN96159.1 MAG: hypothetical protein COU39_02440 [Candidatus Micrarchaeota archaeon CG10_big_fil_rev_8_21_14_0_10_60_32]PIO02018.1 MAG: hypothetical protein COT58_02210 [Candidatus Micrarchaeota archaeon CG09_land_8_20_14_0_10_60_16]PIY91948.1 MAG: hypothetical protein COY71_00445 [Candidatus Micrarchaeota archaeon CG_4_10_14_0_8_um_filter_60_7]PIZ91092.1 MAG: hypothetical protein COX86_01480 [Candidatus Mi